MCLNIEVVPALLVDRPSTERRGLRRFLPRVAGSRRTVLLNIHGCELLSDDADWNAPTWDLSPAGAEELTAALTELFADAPGPAIVPALWDGDTASSDVDLPLSDLFALIRSNRLGNFTRYIVYP